MTPRRFTIRGHHDLDVVTRYEGHLEGVLIRALEPARAVPADPGLDADAVAAAYAELAAIETPLPLDD